MAMPHCHRSPATVAARPVLPIAMLPFNLDAALIMHQKWGSSALEAEGCLVQIAQSSRTHVAVWVEAELMKRYVLRQPLLAIRAVAATARTILLFLSRGLSAVDQRADAGNGRRRTRSCANGRCPFSTVV